MNFILNLNKQKEQSVQLKISKRQYRIKHSNGREFFKAKKAHPKRSCSNRKKN